jgi:hypothetical protein
VYFTSSETPTISESPAWLASPIPRRWPMGSTFSKYRRTNVAFTTTTLLDAGVSR